MRGRGGRGGGGSCSSSSSPRSRLRTTTPPKPMAAAAATFLNVLDGCSVSSLLLSLQAWASTEVAEKAQALRTAKPPRTYLDYFEKDTYLGLGGRKSHKKSRKSKRR